MKKVKRNAVILTVLLFVCAAVYLNWSYGQKEKQDVLSGEADESAEGQVLTGQTNGTDTDEYFASARLNRQQARNEASQTLQTVSTTEGIPQETIDTAAEQMMKISPSGRSKRRRSRA